MKTRPHPSPFELHFHGVRVRISGAAKEVASHFRHDFHYFLKPLKKETPALTLTFSASVPSWGKGRRLGRALIFRSQRGERRLQYHPDVWVEYRPNAGVACVFGRPPELLYESALAVVLSFVGEWLDQLGLHRVHGLGIATQGEGALFLASSGTGKSTLALGLLKATALDLLSDDTPLIAAGGEMLSFPQRIATRERPKGFAPRHLRRFRRVHYGEKYVLGAEAFADRIQDRAPVSQVFVTSRQPGKPRLHSLPRWRLAWPLTKWLVVGFETPQMWELFLRPSLKDVNRKAGILRSRVGVAVGLLKKAKAYRLVLGADSAENVRFVERFLKESRCD